MKNLIINKFEKRVFKDAKPLPEFRSGDTVRVHYKIQEGADASKFRIQTYEGIVTRLRKGTAGGSFTVRKISAGGVGVERVFPTMSPLVDKVEVVAQGRVRRSRLYYLRDLSGKAARIRSRYISGEASES
jgi:large subunit ribosomal protein L19